MKIIVSILAVLSLVAFVIALISIGLLIYWLYQLINDYDKNNKNSTYSVKENIGELIVPWYIFSKNRLTEQGTSAKYKIKYYIKSTILLICITIGSMGIIEILKATT